MKLNSGFKDNIYKYIYTNNISFSTINSWYNSRFGSPIPFSNFINDSVPVFNEELQYSDFSKYKDGVSLSVGFDYLVPALENGIVIFIGEKEGYGKTIIVQQENGIDVCYSNINEVNVKLYDYIKKGSLLGNVNDLLYLVFIKNGEVIDYESYL